MSVQREQLRAMVRGAYDLQKLRIQMGNRIVGNFKVKLGQSPGKPEEEMDKEGKEILAALRASYKKITDGVARFPKQGKFTGDEVISTYTELCLCAEYFELEENESGHFQRIGTVLREFPIYTAFLEGVSGVGPAMAGVIISEIDITRAYYPSSLWKYAGLDTVEWWQLDHIETTRGIVPEEALEHIPETRPLSSEYLTVDQPGTVPPDTVVFDDRAQLLYVRHRAVAWSCEAVYRREGGGKGRSRQKGHLVKVKYINKDGEEKEKDGISFNPFLKTKLIGVLGSSFLKVKDSPYKTAYYNYKHRLESEEKYKDDTKGHRHNMAIRYAVKLFLADLYTAWRPLEGLPVAPTYHEGKLGHVHRAA